LSSNKSKKIHPDIRLVCFVNIILKFIVGIMFESSMHLGPSVTHLNVYKACMQPANWYLFQWGPISSWLR